MIVIGKDVRNTEYIFN